MKEITAERCYLRGVPEDRRSINRHSMRVYEAYGRYWKLDRTLDASPPFFDLSVFHEPYGAWNRIPVRGQDYWGDGWSWTRAERVAKDAIDEWERSRDRS